MVRSSIHDYSSRIKPDPITNFEGRFESLRHTLSISGCRKIGYVTDIPEDADWFIEYYRLQYALAPVIVEPTTSSEMVVANLRDPASIHRILDNGFKVVADYGRGVTLLSHDKP